MLIAFGTFTVAAVLIVLLPGPDTLVVVRGMVRGGRRGAGLTALGVLAGLCCWVAAAALGLAALLKASETGYEALKIAGAAYLVWIGVQSLRSIRRPAEEVALHGDGPTAPAAVELRGRSGFLGGLLTDILNPKVGVFFVSFLPGFVPDGASVGLTSIAFGAIFVVLTALYFVALIAVSATITTWMQTPRIRRRLDALTGLVLVGFGVRLATES
ncbi:MAG: LysE family translocator [Nocardioides sp.]|uniref:LysE family translocator n=1 Tax=Nocardioides sp. TaxID=35761 RepID=UPI0039E6D498